LPSTLVGKEQWGNKAYWIHLLFISKYESIAMLMLMLCYAMLCYAIPYYTLAENCFFSSFARLILYSHANLQTRTLPSKRTPWDRLFRPQHTLPALLIRRSQLPIRLRTLTASLSPRRTTPNQWRRTRRHTGRTPLLTRKVTRILNTLPHILPPSTSLPIPPFILTFSLCLTTHTPQRRISTSRMLQIFLSTSFDGTFIIGVKANSTACISADALAILCIGSCTGSCAVFEEEIEEFVFDC
jgi:hypothetical protein